MAWVLSLKRFHSLFCFYFFFVFFFNPTSSFELHTNSLVLTHDSRNEIRVTSFGFIKNGYYSLNFTNFVIEKNEQEEVIGLYTRKTQTTSSMIEIELFCQELQANESIHDIENSSQFIQFTKDFDQLFIERTISEKEEGLWTSSIINCRKNTHISATVHYENYNVIDSQKLYLSYGDFPLPLVYGILSVAYFLCGIIWLTQLICKKDRKVLWPHWLMLSLLLLKTVTLFLFSMKYYNTKMGKDFDGWTISYYIFTFLRGTVSLIILLLIGTGWIFIKPFLNTRDKRVFMIVIPLQIFANIAQIVMTETEQGSGSWSFWSLVFMAVDIICCVLILTPIHQTRKHLEQAHPEGKMQNLKQKYKLWGQFYIITITYMYFTRILVRLLSASLPFHVLWISPFCDEFSTLLFYCIVGYKFRPVSSNPYLQVEIEEDITEEVQMESLSTSHKRKPTNHNPEE